MTRAFLFVVAIFVLPNAVCLADVLETFELYPVQSDSSAPFLITEDGDAIDEVSDEVVASFSDPDAGITINSASIQNAASNNYASFSVASGSGFTANSDVFLGVADLPGFGGSGGPGGLFGDFFSTPQNLTNAVGSAEIRTNGTGALAQFLAIDDNGLEVWTDSFAISSGSFTTYNFASADFTNGDAGFDSEIVVGIGIEFLTQADGSGNTNAYDFDVDNINLSIIPEPNSLVIIGGILLFGFAGRRRTHRVISNK